MPRPRNSFIQRILTTACIAFGRLTAVLPLPACRGLGRLAGRMAYWLVPRVRRVALANLDLAYGEELSRREKVRIAREAAENVGIVAAEFSHIPRITPAFVEKHVELQGLEHFNVERGGLIIGAHLSNWEWMASVLRTRFPSVAEVVRPMNDPRLNNFVDGTRRAVGVETVPKEGAGPEVIRLLRAGGILGLLIDQSPRENAVPIQFFGHTCWGTIAPVMAAARTRTPIHVVSMTRDRRGRYTLEFHPPLEMTRSGDLQADLLVNTQRCQDAIEDIVRRHPGQWLWLHRRWKPRPRLDEEWEQRKARTKKRQDS